MPDHLLKLIPKLAGQRVIVLGDVILDEYLIGRATRLSREAPVPVLEFEERRLIPGGAANPAPGGARPGVGRPPRAGKHCQNRPVSGGRPGVRLDR